MFGPNPVPPVVPVPTHDHRSAKGVALRARVIALLTREFGLEEYDVILLPGPATLAMQAVIETVGGSVDVAAQGRFADRWRSMRLSPCYGAPPWTVYCLLETSTSTGTLQPPPGPSLNIVDAVSGFPFYPLPLDTAIFVTTSNKLLGAAPGLAIIGVRKDVWGVLENPKSEIRNPKSERFSYLDLRRHRGDQFLTTAPMPVLAQLEHTIPQWRTGKTVQQITDVCALLTGVIPPEIFIGERVCPVLTLDRAKFDARFPGVAARWELYPGSTATDRYHVFTYSEAPHWYRAFAQELLGANKEGRKTDH
jgi:aspartate aminotransferase-like enzyme